MDKSSRKIERLELLQKYLSVLIAIASFWIIAFFWNYYSFVNLELVPRLGLAAALSWVAFLHAEAIGMLIMSMMKEKWQSEAQQAREKAQEAQFETQKAQLRAQAWESQAQAREAQAQAREAQAQLQVREAQLLTRETELRARETELRVHAAQLQAQEAQAREAQSQEREAQAQEREAQAQETIRDLRRRLEAAERGEDANGANA